MDTVDKPSLRSALANSAEPSHEMERRSHINGTDRELESVYYGVHIPSDIQIQDADGYSNVFQDKIEALKVVKKYKKARFKAFNFYHEAVEFAEHGSEYPNNNTTPAKSNALYGNANLEGLAANKDSVQLTVGEKPPPFRGPKSQELVKLRKGIEAGQFDFVRSTIWINPRYLISSGDTPSILQEGFRYNALHVAAKAKNREMCELILNTVANTNFIKLLYGDDSNQDADERAKMLIDLYLNTPDKGLNETPLHFAVKFGAVDVVELLVSFPQCDKTVKNKFGKSPNMIICERCEANISQAVKNKIAMLLEETFYVPVLRSEDNCSPPVIGEPFAPSSPPNFNTDILLPRIEIHAYAGPMGKDCAERFRRVWKTPPRSLKVNSGVEPGLQSNSGDASTLKFKDLDKGLERLGRVLAQQYQVGWKEYWPFLNSFVDLASAEGLQQFENYLAERVSSECTSSSSTPKYTSGSESDLISNSTKARCKDTNQDTSLSPISSLGKDFEACVLNDNHVRKCSSSAKTIVTTSSTPNETSQEPLTEAQLFKPDLSPFLCVEKSCQIFANRISNNILHLLEHDHGSITVKLEMEIKQLELLMMSFMDDSRFVAVDFHLVHYRLGCLISNKLKECLLLEDEYDFMKKTLEHWLENCSKHFDYFSSDDESVNYRQTMFMQKKSTSKNKQVVCLLECILSTLSVDLQTNSTNINSEEECLQVWGNAKSCACVWQSQAVRKSSLIKKSNSFKYSTRAIATLKNENVSRQLFFGEDQGLCSAKDFCDAAVANSISHTSGDSSSSDDEYVTAPSTPRPTVEDDEDSFEDSFLPENDVFIDGNVPTKTDYAAYNALTSAHDRLNPVDYPYIYKWRHTVSLYPEYERRSWTNPSIARCAIGGSPITSSPLPRQQRLNSPTLSFHTPPSSWLRITGENSPRDTLKRYRRSNISFNL